MKLKDIPIDQIIVGKNIRLESEDEGELGGLMESIGRHGQLQPVVVVQRDGKYELVAGHRRLTAMRARHEATIAAVIHDSIADMEVPYLRLAENMQRKQLSPREIVAAIDGIKADHPGITIKALAKLLCRTDAWISMQYQAARATRELLEDGMAKDQVAKLTVNDLVELDRLKERKERLAIAEEVSGGSKKVAAEHLTGRKRERRGAYIDYSGGFAIMGDSKTRMIRVICTSIEARDEVIASLLQLKSRRLRRKSA